MKYTNLKNLGLTLLVMTVASTLVSAQSKQKSADEMKYLRNDSIILADMINPQERDAQSNGQEPDWEGMRANILLKYDGVAADRAVTKARIYYYYSKDWALFATAIVHFTEAYEDKEDLNLMNKNAKFILRYSQNPKEWKMAQAWVKHAVDKDPSNAGYKETWDALEAKIKG